MNQLQIYSSPSEEHDIERSFAECSLRSINPHPLVIERGIIVPRIYSPGREYRHGVLDAEGRVVEGSGETDGLHAEELLKGDIPYVDATAVYLGPMRDEHYGHLLVESTARLWFWQEQCEDNNDIIPVFSFWENTDVPACFPSYVEELFSLYGGSLRHRMRCISRPTRFARVVVPPPAWGVSFWTDRALHPFRRIAAAVPPASYDKVYFSKAKFRACGVSPTYGEEVIEENFVANGYHIAYPEQLSVREQISLVKGARYIAGVSGTPLHNIIFSDHLEEALILLRAPLQSLDWQFVINRALAVRCSICSVYALGLISTPLVYRGPYMLGMSCHLRSYFIDHKMHISRDGIPLRKHLRDYLDKLKEISLFVAEKDPRALSGCVNYWDFIRYLALDELSHPSPLLSLWRIASILAPWPWRKKCRARYKELRRRKKYIGFVLRDMENQSSSITD